MKDVGEFFENKLNKGKKIPSESLWEKINTSLDTEKLRKKRILFYWFLGGSIPIILGLLLLYSNINFSQSHPHEQKNQNPVVRQSDISLEPDNKKIPEILKEDTLISTNKNEERLQKIVITNQDSKLNENEKSTNITSKIQQKNSGNKSKNNISTDNAIDENFTITKNYHYYNSENNKTIVTKNINEIDSLIFEQYKFLDSITPPETDSLEE